MGLATGWPQLQLFVMICFQLVYSFVSVGTWVGRYSAACADLAAEPQLFLSGEAFFPLPPSDEACTLVNAWPLAALLLVWHLGMVYAMWDVSLLKRGVRNKRSAWCWRLGFLLFFWPLWAVAPGMSLLFEPFLTDLAPLFDQIQAFTNRHFFVPRGLSLRRSLCSNDTEPERPGFQLNAWHQLLWCVRRCVLFVMLFFALGWEAAAALAALDLIAAPRILSRMAGLHKIPHLAAGRSPHRLFTGYTGGATGWAR